MSKAMGFGPLGSCTVDGIEGARPRVPCTVDGTADTRVSGARTEEPAPSHLLLPAPPPRDEAAMASSARGSTQFVK
jgi:hypothetical protein